MLDKIVISSDRKSARVYFAADRNTMQEGDGAYHSVTFHSDEDVTFLIYDIIFAPSIRLEEIAKEREARFLASLEDTVEIDLQLVFKDVA